MDARGPQEARLLAVERGIGVADRDLRALRTRAIALGQRIWDAWGDVGASGGGTFGPTMCAATYSGALHACGAGVTGQTITLTDHMSGSPLGTCTTGGGGNFTGSLTITSPMQTVDVKTAVTGYAATTNTFTLGCGTNSLGTITLGSGSGVATISLCSGLCLISALPFTDSIYGSGTLTWNGSKWQGCISGLSYAAYAAGGCAAQTIAITYGLNTSGQLSVSWVESGLTSCPLNSTCGSTMNITKALSSPSTSCGYPATATFTMGGSLDEKYLRRGAASQTITVSLMTS